MSAFQLNVVNINGRSLREACGISETRMSELAKVVDSLFAAERENSETNVIRVLQGTVAACDTLEEVVMLTYAIGGYANKMQTRNLLAAAARD